ncbi:hypothetical protein FBU30_004774 [Linnemannia zychae]|nr:hypothetical protein FBU30_004774 [Linnemannia zychae]
MTIRTSNNPHHSANGSSTALSANPNLNTGAGGIPQLISNNTGHGHAHGQNVNPSHMQQESQSTTTNSSPPAAEETPEQVLMASFKAAALSVTQLYKDSLKNQRAEHIKGYEAALQDLLSFIATHPVVQEKKELGMTEDEIRQNTSLSIDDIVRFISNARAMNCNSAAHAAAGNEMHLHQQQQQQQLQAQQAQQHGGGGDGSRLLPSFAAPNPIFPNNAFTFTPPIFHPGLGANQVAGELQSIFPGQEGGIGQQMAVDSLKRRYALQDFNMAASRMMGGSINSSTNSNMISTNGRLVANQPLNLNVNVNMDSFGAFHDQPPFKRGRRREGE